MLSGLSLYEMGLFYCRRRGERTCFQELVAMAEESGVNFVSFLMDTGREYMLKVIQELRAIPSVLWCVCCKATTKGVVKLRRQQQREW